MRLHVPLLSTYFELHVSHLLLLVGLQFKQFEKEMKVVSERHEQDIKDVFEEAKAEVTARSRELRRHLQNEYETKIVTLERRYQSDLTRVCSFLIDFSYFTRFDTHAFLFSQMFE